MSEDRRTLPPAIPPGAPCMVDFEGEAVRAFAGEPLAVALFAAGIRTLGRSTKYHRPRGAFCFQGHCASCFLRVDGRPNVRSCLVPSRAGLRCERQNAFPSAEVDVLAAADWMFPHGMDHYTLLTGNRPANRVLMSLVRQLGGSGTLPDTAPSTTPSMRHLLVDVCVVGAGPAGLAAATAIARQAPRAQLLVVDEQSEPGGSWLAHPAGAARAAGAIADAQTAGVSLHSRATVIGFFPEDIDPALAARADAATFVRGTLAIVTPDQLLRVTARAIVYATGGYDQNLAFLDNDGPGVLSARACGRLAFRHGVQPAARVAIIDEGGLGDALAAGLTAANVPIVRVDARTTRPLAAVGGADLRGLEVVESDGRQHRIETDLIAIAATPAPAAELARQHGAAVHFDLARGGYAVVVDPTFRTGAPGIFACGDVTGYLGPEAAARAGAAAGQEIAQTLHSP